MLTPRPIQEYQRAADDNDLNDDNDGGLLCKEVPVLEVD